MKYLTIINDKQYEVEVQKDGSVLVNGEPREVDFLALGPSLYSVIRDDKSHEVVIESNEGMIDVLMQGKMYSGKVLDERAQLMATRGGGVLDDTGEVSIRAPMPGLVVSVPVQEGDEVQEGQTVVILESMKMQNELKTPRDGVVQRISCEEGQSVEQKRVLVTIT